MVWYGVTWVIEARGNGRYGIPFLGFEENGLMLVGVRKLKSQKPTEVFLA